MGMESNCHLVGSSDHLLRSLDLSAVWLSDFRPTCVVLLDYMNHHHHPRLIAVSF